MKRLLFALMLIPSLVHADWPRYVNAGTYESPGTQTGAWNHPYMRIGQADSTVTADSSDTYIYVRPGTYSAAPKPVHPSTNGHRYTYVTTNYQYQVDRTTHPATLMDFNIGGIANTTIAGFRSIADFSVGTSTTANRDSIADCLFVSGASASIQNKADYITFIRCRWEAAYQVKFFTTEGTPPNYYKSAGLHLIDCYMNMLGSGGDVHIMSIGVSTSTDNRNRADSTLIHNCTMILHSDDTHPGKGLYLYYAPNTTIEGSHIILDNNTTLNPRIFLAVRDSSSHFTLRRDTIQVIGTVGIEMWIPHNGNNKGGARNDHVVVDSCYITSNGSNLFTQKDSWIGNRFTHNVFVMVGGGTSLTFADGSLIFRPDTIAWNTFIQAAPNTAASPHAIYSANKFRSQVAGAALDDSFTVHSNVFIDYGPGGTAPPKPRAGYGSTLTYYDNTSDSIWAYGNFRYNFYKTGVTWNQGGRVRPCPTGFYDNINGTWNTPGSDLSANLFATYWYPPNRYNAGDFYSTTYEGASPIFVSGKAESLQKNFQGNGISTAFDATPCLCSPVQGAGWNGTTAGAIGWPYPMNNKSISASALIMQWQDTLHTIATPRGYNTINIDYITGSGVYDDSLVVQNTVSADTCTILTGTWSAAGQVKDAFTFNPKQTRAGPGQRLACTFTYTSPFPTPVTAPFDTSIRFTPDDGKGPVQVWYVNLGAGFGGQ
jgi:hypothetical protein